MQNCMLACAFALNINISLFTYYNRCQHKQVEVMYFVCGPPLSQCASSTHPTGMHSCLLMQ